jgi:hypothetical protein
MTHLDPWGQPNCECFGQILKKQRYNPGFSGMLLKEYRRPFPLGKSDPECAQPFLRTRSCEWVRDSVFYLESYFTRFQPNTLNWSVK